jgi:hypothetical protein
MRLLSRVPAPGSSPQRQNTWRTTELSRMSRKNPGHIDVKAELKQSITRDTLDKDGNGTSMKGEWKDFLVHTQSVVGDATGSRGSIPRPATPTPSARRHALHGAMWRTGCSTRRHWKSPPGDRGSKWPLIPQCHPPFARCRSLSLTAHGKGGVACADCHVSQKRIDDHVWRECHDKSTMSTRGRSTRREERQRCTDCHDPTG